VCYGYLIGGVPVVRLEFTRRLALASGRESLMLPIRSAARAAMPSWTDQGGSVHGLAGAHSQGRLTSNHGDGLGLTLTTHACSSGGPRAAEWGSKVSTCTMRPCLHAGQSTKRHAGQPQVAIAE